MGWMKAADAFVRAPELLLRGRFSFTFDKVQLVARRLSRRQRMNMVRAGADMVLRREHAWALPPVVQIEPTNSCNLQCPLCPTGLRSMKRPIGFMSLGTFEKILDEIGDTLVFAILYGWGEPFLNREMPRMIQACTTRNICTLTSTSGHCLQSYEEALDVVDAGLSALIIALEGSTQEIYDTYRIPGDIEKVKRCAASVEEAKAKRGSKTPYTNVRTVLTLHTEEDTGRVEALAREIGVNMVSFKSLGCLPANDKFKEYEPHPLSLRRFRYENHSHERRRDVMCPYPFRQPTIFWDGSIVGCEFDYDVTIPWGNLDKESFTKAWNGDPAVELRRAIRNQQPSPAFCNACPYRGRAQNSSVILWKELRPA